MQDCTTVPTETLPQHCPACGGPLRLRHRKSDDRPFFGCSRFPQCRYTAPCFLENDVHKLQSAYRDVEARNAILTQRCRALEFQLHTLTQEYRTLQREHASPALSQADLDHTLKQLIATAHPDKWSQGQPANALAHEIVVALNALRQRLGKVMP